MGLKLLFFVSLAVAAAAVSEDDYDSYFGSWSSDEVPSEDLGIVDTLLDKLIDDTNVDYPFYDTPGEETDKNESKDTGDGVEESSFPVLKDVDEAKSSDTDEIISEENADDRNVIGENISLSEAIDELRNDFENHNKGDIDNNADESSNENKEPENVSSQLNEEVADNFNDYQVEDNRSDEKDERLANDEDVSISDFKENFENEESPDISQIVEDAKKFLEGENSAFEEDIEMKDLAFSENNNEETIETKLDDSDKDDTEEILESFLPNEFPKDVIEAPEAVVDEEINNNPNAYFDELEALFGKYENEMIDSNGADANDENIISSEQEENFDEDHDNEDDEDTVDKVYEDLNADLDKLFATWDKLTAGDSKMSAEETKQENSIEEYEEKYDRPYKEGVVLNQRDNFNPEIYENAPDSIIKIDGDSKNYTPNIIDLSRYLSQEEEEDTSNVDEEVKNTSNDINKSTFVEDLQNEALSDSADENDEKIQPIPEKTPDIDDVTEKDYANLIYKFSIDHHDEIETNVQDETVSPIYMSLEADQTIEITSPNYPNAYPTNNVVDWILEGEGTFGIELNITELNLRGAQGDYLLINPGAAKDGQGLLFSYQLPAQSNLRQYRFTSANRLYIRFNAGSGLNFLPGFRLTVKPIWSAASNEGEGLPEPEALLPAPPATLKVNLGGLRYPYFMEVKEIFRRIIADMATMYINANRIDPGLNSTLETTQITNIASCNVNWPRFEECVAVTFGVPLFYDGNDNPESEARLIQEDLTTMWTTYVMRDPFAARLRVLGITEFAVPNDNRMMMMWAVLTICIFMAAALLGFALWRFSCFEGYSRMKELGDTDSIRQGKRGLDLYPTPHQPLPPLYADNDIKWADSKYEDTTRVDLGGLANRSYARDELLEIDSDEDNIAPRDRYSYTTDV